MQVVQAGERQRVGRRLGLEPYYEIAERGPGRLRLESRPAANRRAGLAIMAGGAALLLAATLVAGSGLLAAASGAGFAAAALAAVVGGLLGALGYQRALGGYAVLTTRNTVLADADSGTLTLTQVNRVASARSQQLPFARIQGLRLRRRPLAVGWPLRRVRPIIALELITATGEIWVVDSAGEVEELRAAAESLSEVLGIALG